MRVRERLVKIEERVHAAKKALKLARKSVNKSNLGSIATFLLSTLAIAVAWFKR
jgi:hypothetical protein